MSIPRRDEDPQWLGLIATGHKEECKFRVATECAIAIEWDERSGIELGLWLTGGRLNDG